MQKNFDHLERYRRAEMSFNVKGQRAGVFQIPCNATEDFICIAHDGVEEADGDPLDDACIGWEHVSVRVVNTLVLSSTSPKLARTPTWEEMVAIKRWFWEDNEWVVQYHPAASEYSNQHPHVLHLWRNSAVEIPRPASQLVGLVTGPEALRPLPPVRSDPAQVPQNQQYYHGLQQA